MLDSFNNLLSVLHLGTRAESGCSHPIGHPHRDWNLLSIVVGGLLLIGAVFDGFMYLSVLQDVRAQPPVPAYSAGPSGEDLSQELAGYASRKAEHTSLLEKAPSVADPSKAQ